jgi:hypothetical protein
MSIHQTSPIYHLDFIATTLWCHPETPVCHSPALASNLPNPLRCQPGGAPVSQASIGRPSRFPASLHERSRAKKNNHAQDHDRTKIEYPPGKKCWGPPSEVHFPFAVIHQHLAGTKRATQPPLARIICNEAARLAMLQFVIIISCKTHATLSFCLGQTQKYARKRRWLMLQPIPRPQCRNQSR